MEDFDVIVIDGMNVLWRAAYATGSLGYEDRNGFIETGAVYGFLDMILSVVHRNKFALVLIAWEGSREGRRNIDEGYKAHRDEPDAETVERMESVYNQRDIAKAILKHTSWGQITAPGWEADDAIATSVAAAHRQGLRSLIFSNDTDLFQCLRDEPAVYQWKSGKNNNPLWTPARLIEEKGVTPEQWAAVKGLGGDASDGYKGVPGIGETWACRFIAGKGSYAAVRKAALAVVAGEKDEVLTAKKSESIVEHLDYADACFDLAQVRDQLPTQTVWGDADKARLFEVLKRLRFHSLCSNKTLRRMT